MNNTIKEDIYGEEMHNTGKQFKQWSTNAYENRRNENTGNLADPGLNNGDRSKSRSNVPFDRRIQNEYEKIKAKDKMLREARK